MPMHLRPPNRRARRLALLLAAIAAPFAALAQPLGTTFTYQGQLTDAGQPATGLYDLQVCLFDSPSNPAPITCAPDFGDVPVEDGVFTLALDFGATPFAGQQRYLELRVRAGAATGGYTILSPRQLVRATPEALRAAAASAAPWSGLTGVPAGFADGVDNDSGGTVTSVTAGTGLGGGTITSSGTIGIANGGVGPAQIAPNAVDGSRIADGSVAAADLVPDAIGAGQIAANGVGASELADNAVDTPAVQDLAITQAKIASGAVGAAQIAAGAVGLAQINPAQVQARIGGTCAVGEYFRGIHADGSVACEPVPGVPRITIVDAANSVGAGTSIAIGADGLPVISYFDATLAALKVAKCGNAACSGVATITTVDDPSDDVGRASSIAVGADGLPVISYFNATADALKVAKCSNADCTGTATITTVHDLSNLSLIHSAIAIGADGLPAIAYIGGSLRFLKCGNPACSSGNTLTTLDGTNVDGSAVSLAIPATDGRPVVSFHDGATQGLAIAKCGNGACTSGNVITPLDDPASEVGLQCSLAVNAGGNPVVSYYDTTNAALKVATCGNANCTSGNTILFIENSANEVGNPSAIASGSDGLPVIAYYDFTLGVLKVAKCGNPTCAGALVTFADGSSGGVGNGAAIAIGIDGLPVISYHRDGGRLKVAKCGTRSCL